MQNILNKLGKIEKAQPKRSKFTKAKPNRVAVKLAMVDEIYDYWEEFQNAESDASWLAYEWGDQLIEKIDEYRMEIGQIDDFIVNGNIRNLEESMDNLFDRINAIREKSDELGIDPNDIVQDYDEIERRIGSAPSLLSDAQDKYREIVDYAGFLGNFWK